MNDTSKNKKYNYDALLILIVSVVCFVIFFKFITLQNVYLFKDIGSDTYNAVYPHLIHISDYLRTEGVPRWSFAQGLGQNITNSGIDNPFNWLLYLLGKDNLAYGIIFVEILKILLTAFLSYRWLLVIFKNHLASIFGAIAFVLGGYMIVGGSWYVHSWLCFKVLLLLWAFEKGYRKRIWLWWSLAVFWALDVNIIFIIQLLFVYLLFRMLQQQKLELQNLLKNIIQPALAYGLLGVLMKAPLLGSIFYRIWNSPRLTGGFSISNELQSTAFFESTGHYITAFLRLFGNDLLANGSNFLGWKNYLEAPLLYCGVLTILLIPQAFVLMPKWEKKVFFSMLSFWVLVVTFPYLRYSLYWFSGDYYKIVVDIFLPLSLIFCACKTLIEWQKGNKLNIKLLLTTTGVLLIALLGVGFLSYQNNSIIVEKATFYWWQTILIIVVESICLVYFNSWIKTDAKKTYANRAVFFTVLLLSVELLVVNYSTVNHRETISSKELQKRIGYNDYTVEIVDFLKDSDSDFFRISKRFSSSLSNNNSLNDAKAQGFYGTSSYSSFNQGYYVNFLKQMNVISPTKESESRWIMGLRKRPLLEKLVGVKYLIGDGKLASNELSNFATFNGKSIFKNKTYMPLGFVYTQYFPEESFLRMNTKQKDCSILNAVVIPDDLGKQKLTYLTRNTNSYTNNCVPTTTNTLELTYFSNNKLVFEGKAPAGIFFASIPYDTGWTAQITHNGQSQKAKIDLVNFGFMGIDIPQAVEDIKIKLEYTPPFAKPGLVIAIVSWGFLVFLFYKKRNQKLI